MGKEKELYFKVTIKDIDPNEDIEFLENQAPRILGEMIKETLGEKTKDIYDLEIINVEQINKP